MRNEESNILDHSVLMSFVDGDTELLRGVIKLFLNSYPSFMSALGDAIRGDDQGALARAAHTFKGSGGYFLSDSARERLIELESIATSGNWSNAPGLFLELEQEMERLKPELSILAAD